MDKRRIVGFIQTRLFNPIIRRLAMAGLAPGVVVLETKGRKSGEPRRTPVGKAIEGDVLWIVAEHGRRAGYVRNIESDPRVRVRAGRRWRTGTARTLPEDDPRERQRTMPQANARTVRLMGTDLLTVRVDLDPE